jgi:hypothetical protein
VRRREIVFAPEAQEDLFALFDWISAAAGERAATTYIERLEAYCPSFDLSLRTRKAALLVGMSFYRQQVASGVVILLVLAISFRGRDRP